MSPLLYQLSYTANRCTRPPPAREDSPLSRGLAVFSGTYEFTAGWNGCINPWEELSSRRPVNQ